MDTLMQDPVILAVPIGLYQNHQLLLREARRNGAC